MSRASLFLIAAGFPLVLSLVCPTFTCGPLTQNACALKLSEVAIQLNTLPCSSTTFCSAERMYEDWWWRAGTAIGTTYPCLDASGYDHITVSDRENYVNWPCFQQEDHKDLLTGSHPKDCASDHDCLLQDGTWSRCLCSIRDNTYYNSTRGICSPDMSSSLFAEYWNQCGSNEFLTNVNIGFYYWVVQQTYQITARTGVSCAGALFWEYSILSQAHTDSLVLISSSISLFLPIVLAVAALS